MSALSLPDEARPRGALLTDLYEASNLLDGYVDCNTEGTGPNSAMRAQQLIDAAIRRLEGGTAHGH